MLLYHGELNQVDVQGVQALPGIIVAPHYCKSPPDDQEEARSQNPRCRQRRNVSGQSGTLLVYMERG